MLPFGGYEITKNWDKIQGEDTAGSCVSSLKCVLWFSARGHTQLLAALATVLCAGNWLGLGQSRLSTQRLATDDNLYNILASKDSTNQSKKHRTRFRRLPCSLFFLPLHLIVIIFHNKYSCSLLNSTNIYKYF